MKRNFARIALRFIGVVLLASLVLSFLMRWLLDEPADQRISVLYGTVLWTVSALVGVLDAIQTSRRESRRNISTTPTCQTCGYNLTGNVSGVCPECGKEIHRIKVAD